ncbi:helix-turn-helix domain-containing protein [Klebsiella michiganensis]|uniref:helix-turn-helix domain-containing protein n=1 Tax=Klebsiella michiganensis TaxID=1134687 RepID=UPI001071B088|nr:helix-turn-helix domain-containing protein [Klebsiella michiganensis]MBZ7626006.1 transcriptional regulator [Klebsiella michiganensis]QLP35736.1 helix-turn-helix domain-containing protein [Klebsiella michiganensis]HBM2917557.1 helix-turn-helix domain-containing protein [Klebsiella michiganensis]
MYRSLLLLPRTDATGLASSTLTNALTQRWPNSERLIAEAFDFEPGKIRPSRCR